LYLGLDQVKDLRSRTIEKIIHYRPFTSLGDFLSRVAPRPMEARNLIRCGGLAGMGTIPSLLMQLEQGPPAGRQPSLFEQPVEPGLEEIPLMERLSAQEEILGIGVETHPLEVYGDRLSQLNTVSTAEALDFSGKKVIVAGVRQSLHRSRTSGGEMMAFLTLEDFEGTLDVVLFPGVYRKMPREAISENYPLLVEGWVEMDPGSGEPYLRAERVELLK
jgi:DNA polymerase-3 subunit alpha